MQNQEADVPAMVAALIGRRVRTDLPGAELDLLASGSTPTGKHQLTRLPRQVAPTHDDLAVTPAHLPLVDADPESEQSTEAPTVVAEPATVAATAAIRERARWTRAGWSRQLLRLALVALAVLTAWSATLAAVEPVATQMNQLALCAFSLMGVWMLLASSQTVVVNLVGSQLRVRQGRRVEIFHLASPYLRVQVSGEVGTRSWALRLERADGSDLVLAEPLVRSKVLHPVVEHHRAVAAQLRASREARFRR